MIDPNSGGWEEYRRLVLREIERFNDNIARLENEFSKIHIELTRTVESIGNVRKDLENYTQINSENTKRITAVENDLAVIKGKAAAFGGLAGFCINALWELIRSFLLK